MSLYINSYIIDNDTWISAELVYTYKNKDKYTALVVLDKINGDLISLEPLNHKTFCLKFYDYEDKIEWYLRKKRAYFFAKFLNPYEG
ncbi:hypothetical protein BC351_01325 [Paenibacillus ferrarius]|uniref:Uncharacterized protein n=1 Tax=Paenibacillus ferrarius TaxID=1469647 RepID=A0A1V4HSK1_9BACL|nr:hypothetical protein [Paenibacillus ferrarius]OPH61911.1 hypothetical protein BC351_01325 [Paenibacillus ferrarius]